MTSSILIEPVASWDEERILADIAAKYSKKYREDWPKEKPDILRAINWIRESREVGGTYWYESCVAVASSRVVLKVRDANRGDFALKVCRPLAETIPLVVKEFETAMPLEHRHIVRIFKSFEVPLHAPEHPIPSLPITLEEYIQPGKGLDEWTEAEARRAQTPDELRSSLFNLVTHCRQVIDAIHYLHTRHVFHCDIKPENVLVSADGAKVVDFGYSVRRLGGRGGAEGSSGSPVGYTWKFALPALRKSVSKMTSPSAAFSPRDHDISYNKIDHYALGRSIEDCVRVVTDRRHELEKSGISRADHAAIRDIAYHEDYLMLVAARLKGNDARQDFPEHQGVVQSYPTEVLEAIRYMFLPTGLASASKDLMKARSDTLATAAPEWDRSFGSRIRVGGTDVPFSYRIRAIFNHPALARLSRVSQLGLAVTVYPAARHSRLEHSMGTYANALRYLESLWTQKDTPFFRCITSYEDIFAVSLAALLHDLGQYPHAHDVEDSLPGIPRHANLSFWFYENKLELGEITYPSLRDVIAREWGTAVADRVRTYLGSRPPNIESTMPKESILWAIISSAIDADKLDYVQRDSSTCGIAYGQNLEVDRLIQSLRPSIRPTTAGAPARVVLGIGEKGLLPAQSLIIAREQIFERVYWHKTVRAFKAMLASALRTQPDATTWMQTIIEETVKDLNYSASRPITSSPPEALHLGVSDFQMLAEIRARLDSSVGRYLIDEILARRPYRVFADLSIAQWQDDSDKDRMRHATEKLAGIFRSAHTEEGVARVENVRRRLQARLLTSEAFHLPDSRLPNYGDAREVVVLLDMPREKLRESRVSKANVRGDHEAEYDLSGSGSPLRQDFVKSGVPRIYVNRSWNWDPAKMSAAHVRECFEDALSE